MTIYESLYLALVTGTLIFICYQSLLMRKALQQQHRLARVQSYLQVWMNHIQTCHLSIATAEKSSAEQMNSMSPYGSLPLEEARRCHFADAVLDFYECIYLLSKNEILEKEAVRVWRDSVPYEIVNPELRAHWRRYHHDGGPEVPEVGMLGIYHRDFMEMVEDSIERLEGERTPPEKHKHREMQSR